jgi:hypothetical protein
MTCKIVRSDDGKIIAIACGSPWGIGVYYHCHDAECFCEGESVYGFPPSEMNPEDFMRTAAIIALSVYTFIALTTGQGTLR